MRKRRMVLRPVCKVSAVARPVNKPIWKREVAPVFWPSPTVRIGDQVERVDERESGFNRAVRGDLGPAPKRERPRFVGKHPLSGALGAMQLYLADVVDGRVAVVRRGDADHAAEIDEVLLGGSPLGRCTARPLCSELCWSQGATHGRRGESKRPGCRRNRASWWSSYPYRPDWPTLVLAHTRQTRYSERPTSGW